jgi:peptidoglycan/xylan/chitin deacetylase (PgdA/CDA1 family)
VFREFGIRQTHGITLYGRTNTHRVPEDPAALEGVEYLGYETIARLANDQIVKLSQGIRFDDRSDLIQFINENDDSIACHGLYHTDFSQMTAADQASDIKTAVSILRKLFPRKPIKYFIPPFNRVNGDTFRICRSLGLSVLAEQGVHLEESLHTVTFRPGEWYRYHHHRFYPESAFGYYGLSLSALRDCLKRNFQSGRLLWPLSGVEAPDWRPRHDKHYHES